MVIRSGLLRRAIALIVGTFVALALTRVVHADAETSRPDLSTPRRAVAAFFDAVEAGDYDRASSVLDLRALSASARAERGRAAARELSVVIERVAWLELAQLSDDPRGRLEDGEKSELLATARVGKNDVPITLARTDGNEGKWLFSSATVAQIPKLYEEHGPGPIERYVPASFREYRGWGLAAWQWLGLPLAALLAFFVGGGITFVLDKLGGTVAARTTSKWDDELVSTLRAPMRLFIGVLLFRVLLDPLALNAVAMHVSSRLVGIATIAVIGWVAVRAVTVLSRWVEDRAKSAATDAGDAELRARGVATQVRVFRRVLNVSISIIAASLMLMQFEVVRTIGVSLLASAGLAGVVLGFAAQRTIGSLIAGIQLSTTQPIRIGDVVIVEKEWGTIEEITLTYVVVKVWDERRLIVPMTRFLEHPFENWTKSSAAIHGTVYFYVDWTFPVEAMRSELDRILDGHPDWDGRTKGVVVTDAKERSLEVRVLVSATDAGKLWNLRVDVRERIVRWLQQFEGGRFLARIRYEDRGSADQRREKGADVAHVGESMRRERLSFRSSDEDS